MSLFRKSLFLLGFVLLGLVMGQSILGGLILWGGADMSQMSSTIDLIESMNNPVLFKIGIGINNLAMFGLSAFLFYKFVVKGSFLAYFGLSKSLNSHFFGISMLFIISIYPFIGFATECIQDIDLPEWAKSMDEDSLGLLTSILEMNTPIDLILTILIVAVTPAVCEELFFRGVIQKELTSHLNNPHVGIIITSIIFSAVHFSVEGFIARLSLGLVLGYTYHYTKCLWYPIIMHLFNNGIGVVSHYFYRDEINNIDLTEGQEIHWSAAIVSLAVAIAIFVLLKTKSEKDVINT